VSASISAASAAASAAPIRPKISRAGRRLASAPAVCPAAWAQRPRPAEVAAHQVQRAHLIERLTFTAPVADLSEDAERLIQGLGGTGVVPGKVAHVSRHHRGPGHRIQGSLHKRPAHRKSRQI
jgi:hypothetical protein